MGGRPGWFLLILASVGLWQARNRALQFVPLVVVFGLCVMYRDKSFETLHVFPWFAHFRVGSRSTTFYPVMLALFASGFRLDRWATRRHSVALVALCLLGATEIYTGYSAVLARPRFREHVGAYRFLEYVASQPGEAVLDWPFCAMGGNGVGAELCPGGSDALGVYSLRRFHRKKVLGQYFGRLHPSQIRPYLDAGWDRMLATADRRRSSESPCMSDAEWSFITDFFRLNDFAGINLWIDQLSQRCIDEFHDRFGHPLARSDIAGIGHVEFIARRRALGGRVDPVAGKSLRLKGVP